MINRYLVVICLFLAVSCKYDEIIPENKVETNLDEQSYVRGHIRIKVNEDFAREIELSVVEGQASTKSLGPDLVSSLEITSLRRTFANGGRFEKRRREAGLHLWYDVVFNENISITKAGGDIAELIGVEEVEYLPEIKIFRGEFKPIPITKSVETFTTTNAPFDDPHFFRQWNLYNDGSIINSVSGADINVLDTWKNNITGSNDIIVAVMDEGIDYDHEDLKDNMWINEAEKNGSNRVDDDGNGYVDDIHGYNFNSRSGIIVKGDHGTHVAGIIGAVNNNGKGICGIAGGNGSGNGVRLMSCQILDENSQYSYADAIAYAADNGAIICQNSWGYETPTYFPVSDKVAIDYFVKNAGTDENGVQTGPMKGGIVIFAAGNYGREAGALASYDKVIGVSAIGADYKMASYSNYGTLLDMTAPGGDGDISEAWIPSTVVNGYAYFTGTSMSSPHISGVAALAVSWFGKDGFTADMLREKLISSGIDIDMYNPTVKGKLGKLINAGKTILTNSSIAPYPVNDISGSASMNTISLEWTIPKDDDDGKASSFDIYYRKSSFSSATISNIPQDVIKTTVYTGYLNAGEKIRTTISSLEFGTSYFFRINASDFSENQSAISNEIKVTTPKNNPPIINALNGTSITIKPYESKILNFNANDPDNHSFTWKFNAGSLKAHVVITNGAIQIEVNGINNVSGTYTSTLQAIDEFGASTSITLTITILPNHPPEVSSIIDNIVISSLNDTQTVVLSEYFSDADNETLHYTISSQNANLTGFSVENDVLTISPKSYGYFDVTVTATDAHGETVSTSFKILIRDGSKAFDIYPNPVINDLYVRTGVEKEYTIKIQNSSGTVVMETTRIIEPFTPALIDMSAFAGGIYTVFIDGIKNPFSIIKN